MIDDLAEMAWLTGLPKGFVCLGELEAARSAWSRSGDVGKPGMKVDVKLTRTAWRWRNNECFTESQ